MICSDCHKAKLYQELREPFPVLWLLSVADAGYADGYPRRLSNMGKVFINGKAYNQIGRICMDVCMADVTGGDVRQGDEAILFGRGGMSIEDVAQIVGTINYELTCLVTERANRVYVNN